MKLNAEEIMLQYILLVDLFRASKILCDFLNHPHFDIFITCLRNLKYSRHILSKTIKKLLSVFYSNPPLFLSYEDHIVTKKVREVYQF